MNRLNVNDLEWLEEKNGCTRYAIGAEESVWLCSECGSENVDEEEHGCYDCHPYDDEHDE